MIKLDPQSPIPAPPRDAEFWTLSHTTDELSLVCSTDSAPATGILQRQDDWVAFRVAGTMEFSLTGIVSRISQPIAHAGLGIFVVSTFDTDYILIASNQAEQAVQTWRAAGIHVIEPLHYSQRLILTNQNTELANIADGVREDALWVADYPTEGDVLISRLARESGEPSHLFQIRLRSTGEAIGGIGFKGEQTTADFAAMEIGYGLAPSMQGHGYGSEALGALIDIARQRGINNLCADTLISNIPSQRILIKNNFREVSRHEDSIWWLLQLGDA